MTPSRGGAVRWGLNFGYYGLATWITVLLSDAGVHDVFKVAFMYACANAPGNAASLLLVEVRRDDIVVHTDLVS